MSNQAENNPAAFDEYEALFKLLQTYGQVQAEAWDRLPDIGLYMDQVTGYVNGRLAPFMLSEEGGLTSSMVNNYVKLSYIDRPENKKYSREQIAALYMLCSLKQVLPISTASALLRYLSPSDEEEMQPLYAAFTQGQTEAAAAVAKETLSCREGGREALLRLALDFSLRAEALRLMAEALVGVALKTDEAKAQSEKEKLETDTKDAKADAVRAEKAEKEKADAERAKEKLEKQNAARAEKAEAKAKKAEAKAAKARENAEKIARAKRTQEA